MLIFVICEAQEKPPGHFEKASEQDKNNNLKKSQSLKRNLSADFDSFLKQITTNNNNNNNSTLKTQTESTAPSK